MCQLWELLSLTTVSTSSRTHSVVRLFVAHGQREQYPVQVHLMLSSRGMVQGAMPFDEAELEEKQCGQCRIQAQRRQLVPADSVSPGSAFLAKRSLAGSLHCRLVEAAAHWHRGWSSGVEAVVEAGVGPVSREKLLKMERRSVGRQEA